MRISRTLGAVMVATMLAVSCGGDDDGDDSGDDSTSEDSSGGGSGDAGEASTVSLLDLGVPAAVPMDFPVPGDTVLIATDEGGEAGERLDVRLGTFASRDDATAIVQPYIESLESGTWSGSSGQGFIDVGGTLSPVQVMIGTTDAEDPPTRITISVPNANA